MLPLPSGLSVCWPSDGRRSSIHALAYADRGGGGLPLPLWLLPLQSAVCDARQRDDTGNICVLKEGPGGRGS